MKKLFLLITLLSQMSFAQIDGGPSPSHHAKHNMFLFGEDKTYVSHLVFKEPHNYQVILEVELPDNVKSKYLEAKRQFPDDLFLYVLDSTDISQIQNLQKISGDIVRETKDGNAISIFSRLELERRLLYPMGPTFRVLYFEELPLSLARGTPPKPHVH